MGHRYLIDGYNLLMRWHRGKIQPGPGNLERARSAMLQWLDGRVEDDDDLLVVFDAAGRGGGEHERGHGRIRVLFAVDHRSADDWIIERCSKPDGRSAVVVTNDWQIQAAARRAKAEVLSSDKFLAGMSADRGDQAEPSLDRPAIAHDPKESASLTEQELLQFRREMADFSSNDQTSADRSGVEAPNSGSSASTANRDPSAEPGLADFYREMRSADFDEGA